MSRIFENAMLIDGSGQKPFLADVLVREGAIAGIQGKEAEGKAENSWDGAPLQLDGKALTPGFIDCHSHHDWFCLKGRPDWYFDPFLAQGVTSFVGGNCGFSASGYEAHSPYLEALGGGLFHLTEGERQPSFQDWFAAVDGKLPANMACLAGHGSARVAVAAPGTKELSSKALSQMLETLDQAMAEGAAGVSLGLMYLPGIFAPYDELLEVARLVKSHDKILTVHPRAESAISLSYQGLGRSHLLRAIDELDRLTRDTGVRFQHSHLIFVGRKSWKDVDEALGILEKLAADGFNVGFDMYPNNYGASVITVILPDWYQGLSEAEKRRPWVRLKLRLMVHVTSKLLGFDFDDITIAYAGEGKAAFQGKTVSQLAKEARCSPFDMYLKLCEVSDYQARVLMGAYQNEAISGRLMQHPMSLYMTDAWVEDAGVQNGAIYGAFPRFFRRALDENFPIEKAIAKATGETAKRFQLAKRGLVKEGYAADLCILDLDRLEDRMDEGLPPLGVEGVFVNGQQVLDPSGLLPGREAAGRAIRV